MTAFSWWNMPSTTIVQFLVLIISSSLFGHGEGQDPQQIDFSDNNNIRGLQGSAKGSAKKGSKGSALFADDATLKVGRGDYNITMPDGVRSYIAYIPEKLWEPPALFLDFHSLASQPGGQLWWSKLKDYAEEWNFIVVYPASADTMFGAFNSGPFRGPLFEATADDLGFVKAIIEEVKKNIIIDPRRIYATGYSSGGAMALYTAYKLPEYIAALSTGGWALNDDTYKQVKRAKADNPNWHPMPYFGIHGYSDPVVCWEPSCFTPWQIIDWNRNGFYATAKLGWHRWANVNDCYGNAVTLSKNPGEQGDIEEHKDHWWDRAYEDCDGGVVVRQILNSNNHAGEFLYPGASGFEAQPNYAERIVEFMFQWKLPKYIEVTEPDWWWERRRQLM